MQEVQDIKMNEWIPSGMRNKIAYLVVSQTFSILLGIVFISLLILNYIQFTNYCCNYTTQQRFGGGGQNKFKSIDAVSERAKPIKARQPRSRLHSDDSNYQAELIESKQVHKIKNQTLLQQDANEFQIQKMKKFRRSFELHHIKLNQKLGQERANRGTCSARNCCYMCCGEDQFEDQDQIENQFLQDKGDTYFSPEKLQGNQLMKKKEKKKKKKKTTKNSMTNQAYLAI